MISINNRNILEYNSNKRRGEESPYPLIYFIFIYLYMFYIIYTFVKNIYEFFMLHYDNRFVVITVIHDIFNDTCS